eukprot:366432-Chlamydomonas_euryale.AAC.6
MASGQLSGKVQRRDHGRGGGRARLSRSLVSISSTFPARNRSAVETRSVENKRAAQGDEVERSEPQADRLRSWRGERCNRSRTIAADCSRNLFASPGPHNGTLAEETLHRSLVATACSHLAIVFTFFRPGGIGHWQGYARCFVLGWLGWDPEAWAG